MGDCPGGGGGVEMKWGVEILGGKRQGGNVQGVNGRGGGGGGISPRIILTSREEESLQEIVCLVKVWQGHQSQLVTSSSNGSQKTLKMMLFRI